VILAILLFIFVGCPALLLLAICAVGSSSTLSWRLPRIENGLPVTTGQTDGVRVARQDEFQVNGRARHD
jgi:hypothetical protein